MFVRGYRLQFAMELQSFNGMVFSETAGDPVQALKSEISLRSNFNNCRGGNKSGLLLLVFPNPGNGRFVTSYL